MMLAYRLVRLIEGHSDDLAAGLLKRVQESESTRATLMFRLKSSSNAFTKFIAIWVTGCWAAANSISRDAIPKSAPAVPTRMSRSAS
ncbi:MAG: hypothetical protein H0X25_12385 [Acidobacteriales bacterium]|nr:hypothetical protein [Terriglobales bacterium]